MATTHRRCTWNWTPTCTIWAWFTAGLEDGQLKDPIFVYSLPDPKPMTSNSPFAYQGSYLRALLGDGLSPTLFVWAAWVAVA